MADATNDCLTPTDDKDELRRRQLQLDVSEPPQLLSAGHEEDRTECGPSAPSIIDNDMNEYVLGGDETGKGASEHLPQYRR